MYHELLMALLGYTGDVFQYDGYFIKVSKDLQVPLFHPSEIIIVDEILEVASMYKRLQQFLEHQFQLDVQTSLNPTQTENINADDRTSIIENTEDISSSTNICIPQRKKLVGLYVSSFCNGVRDILEDYQTEIANLELEILENPYMTVTAIRGKLAPYKEIFQILDSMILKVQAQAKSSSVIVEIVKTDYDHNVHLQDILKRLVPCVNRILYNQIISWTVFGTLHDPKDEFFIKQLQNPMSMSVPTTPNSSVLDYSRISTKSSVSTSKALSGSSARLDNCHEKYDVDYSIVPNHFPVHLTSRILYIGSSIGILSHSEKTRESILLKQQHFHEKLNSLPLDTFRIEELAEVIAEISVEVGKDLHHLVVAETDLPKHLGIVKDFYLTGRGELFHDFLLNLMNITLAKSSLLADVKRAFTLAATRVQVQDDILQRIHIQLPHDISKPTLDLVMSSISLKMEDEWPLHILFSMESLHKYNELFRFLLQVRLLQIELNRIWIDTRRVFRFPIPQGPAELRNVMSFFIDHLQHYLQEDVLENQYAILCNAIEKSENFDQILIAHVHFQTSILAQSFRSYKQLRHFLDEIIKVCFNYVRFITKHLQNCESNDVPVNEGITKEVLAFSVDFRRHMDLLLNLLKNMALNPQSGQYLGQFLLRLDFNQYFSSIITGLNVK